ncbi:MAG: UvrD-helicase domain-containing protein [Coriobacteriales bacterium]|jgi:DNA helicase-2/ATP-dependent DNA helicase PcrA|nr:UvrD-helicase domain-containing protein [Coriobacteriales bacterium]
MAPLDLSTLNPAQLAATMSTEGPLLVLAGAGSGKTRVLTYRIAHLIQDLGVSPYQILAITFTNKAAAEMRGRLGQLLGGSIRGMWVATFHAMCVRMLRADAELVGHTSNFSIYDDYDSRRLMKELFIELNLNSKTTSPAIVREQISRAKNELIDPQELTEAYFGHRHDEIAQVYQRLQERLRQADAMDFDDLLVNAWRLLKDNLAVLAAYQQRFHYILVDEYQDTNHAQYQITSLLAAAHQNLMVVGDDDQSIYSWRGADLRNILEFERDYPNATVVKLEQNYRSTSRILELANAVIAKNMSRKPKRLFTEGSQGEKPAFYLASDERDEGRWIASEINRLHRDRTPYSDFAVFYRTNAQSRVLEDMLIRAGIPYRIVGGTRFFDRAEIRDVMAYLKLVVNPADDLSAKRIINTPRRGLGDKSISSLEDLAHTEGVSFLEACELIQAEDTLSLNARKSIAQFVQLIKDARQYRGTLRDIVEMIVERSGYIDALKDDWREESLSRLENVMEFFGVAAEFDMLDDYVDETMDVMPGDNLYPGEERNASNLPDEDSADHQLVGFMEWLALRTDLDNLTEGSDYVTLMTVHSAKGLEFKVVFLAGMEDGLIPHFASMDSPAEVEEERRLAYVAITRAQELLYFSATQTRNLFGNQQHNPVSMFISDIPAEAIKTIGVGSVGYRGTGWAKRGDRRSTYGSGSAYQNSSFDDDNYQSSGEETSNLEGMGHNPKAVGRSKALDFAVGDIVDHKVFGRGRIEVVEGENLTISFERSGDTKKFLVGFAPLVKLNKSS